MPIKDFIQTDVVIVAKDASLQEIAKQMKSNKIGAIIVVNHAEQDKTPCGIITDRDIAVKMIADDVAANQLKAEDVMSQDLLLIKSNQGVQEVINAMKEKGVRRAPVVDENNKLTGIITLDDLIRLLAGELKSLAELINQQLAEPA
jgi:CBS domain-containing protein